MKILQIGKTYPVIGGVDKVIFELSAGLSQNKINCDILCASIDKKDYTIKQNNYSIIYATGSFAFIASTWISPRMIFKLRKIISNYDIIHIHHPDPMAALAFILAKTKGKKIVLHWHSDIIKQKFLLKLYRPIQKYLIKRSNRIIATSPTYAKGSKDINTHLDKTTIIPIGVQINYEENDRLRAKIREQFKGKKIIYSLGRLCYYKGFEYLVSAAKYLDDNYVVLIGGSGELKEKLMQQIKESGLENKVFLLGRIEDADMSAYYSECTLFCLPSIEKTEAFGIVQIEAMSYGKPIVTTKIPDSGVSWVNKDGYSGINVEPKNEIQLSQAIKDICENEETLLKFSENAKRRFNDEFTSEKMIERVVDVYNNL